MIMKDRFRISIHRILIISHIIMCSISGLLSSKVITLGSIEIFDTHEWLFEPTVYFHCQGENKTTLPDVKKADILYNFTGDESWQPLTDLPDKKCKRCGFYEKDTLKSDDVFDEWELCPGDFVDGEYTRFKEKEFDASFLCPKCVAAPSGTNETLISSNDTSAKGVNIVLVVAVCVLASVLSVIVVVYAYKYWEKRKREQDQARFLKLFEDGDDIEDELGLNL